jgi:hypothetical protein
MTRLVQPNTAAVCSVDSRKGSVAPADLDPRGIGMKAPPHERSNDDSVLIRESPIDSTYGSKADGYRIVVSGGRTGSISHRLDSCSSRNRSRTFFSACW